MSGSDHGAAIERLTKTVAIVARYFRGEGCGDVADAYEADFATLLSRIASLEGAQAWRPIGTAPKDGTPILVAVTGGMTAVVGEAWWQVDGSEGDWWWMNTNPGDYYSDSIRNIQHGEPTHWKPLPEPPDSEEG